MSNFSSIGKRSRIIAGAGIANLVASTKMIIKGSGRKESDEIIIQHARDVNSTANEAIETLHINKESLVNRNYLILAANIDEFLTRVTGEHALTADIFEEKSSTQYNSQSENASYNSTEFNADSSTEFSTDSSTDEVHSDDFDADSSTDFRDDDLVSTDFGSTDFGSTDFGSTDFDNTNIGTDFSTDFGDGAVNGFDTDASSDFGNTVEFGTNDISSTQQDFGSAIEATTPSEHLTSSANKDSNLDKYAIHRVISKKNNRKTLDHAIEADNSESDRVQEAIGNAIIVIRLAYTNNLNVRYKNSDERVTEVIHKTYPINKFKDGRVEYGKVKVTIDDLSKHIRSVITELDAKLDDEEFVLEFEPTSETSEFSKVIKIRKVNNKKVVQSEVDSSSSSSIDSAIVDSSVVSTAYQSSLVSSNEISSQSAFSVENSQTNCASMTTSISESSIQSESMLAEDIVSEVYSRHEATEFVVEVVNDSGDTIESTKTTLNLITEFDANESRTHLDENDRSRLASEFNVEEDSISIDLAHRVITIMKELDYEESEELEEFDESMISYIRQYRDALHKVTDRCYYSKYTSVEQNYPELLNEYVISELVFDISDGTHDTYHEDAILRPSQYVVKLVEMNERFEYRLMSKINEIRSHLNLPQLKTIGDSYRDRRAVATHSILNALRNSSEISSAIERVANDKRILETSQPTSSLELAGEHQISPELVADRMLHSILSEIEMIEDATLSTHIRQLLDENTIEMTAAMMIIRYAKHSHYSEYDVSTTLDYFKY